MPTITSASLMSDPQLILSVGGSLVSEPASHSTASADAQPVASALLLTAVTWVNPSSPYVIGGEPSSVSEYLCMKPWSVVTPIASLVRQTPDTAGANNQPFR